MSERTLKRVVASLALVIVLWLAASILGRATAPGPSDENITELLERIRGGFVAVELPGSQQGRADPVRLERAAGTWTVNGFPADSMSAARFWEAIETAEVSDLVASNPENHERLEIGDDARALVWETSSGTDTLLLGKTGPTFGTVFARLPGEDEVYVLAADIRGAAVRDLAAWRSKRVVAVDTATIQSIEITRPDGSYTLVRTPDGWTRDGDPVRATTVRNVLSELASFSGTGFAEEMATDGTARNVRALDANGTELAVLDIAHSEDVSTVRVAGGEVIYRVPGWRLDRIAPGPDLLEPESDEVGG